jgi:hypothetical protein
MTVRTENSEVEKGCSGLRVWAGEFMDYKKGMPKDVVLLFERLDSSL